MNDHEVVLKRFTYNLSNQTLAKCCVNNLISKLLMPDHLLKLSLQTNDYRVIRKSNFVSHLITYLLYYTQF